MTRSQILEAARERFARAGYAETSLKEIAADVGIKAPSIYAHFSGKEELYAEAYTRSIAEHRDYFTRLLAESRELDPLERLHKILTGVPAFYQERPELVDFHLRSITGGIPAGTDPSGVFRRWDEELAEAIRATYIEGRDAGRFARVDPDAFTAHFTCLMDGLFLQLKHYEPVLYAEHLTRTWDLLATALGFGIPVQENRP